MRGGDKAMQKTTYFLGFILLLLANCKEGVVGLQDSHTVQLEAIPRETWELLAQKKIFFGHQSVGQNIVDGLQDVMRLYFAVRLDIRETSNPDDFVKPVLGHAFVGENRDPKSKIDHFRKILESGVGQLANIAFFKLCFVDVDHNTDVEALFQYYDETVKYLTAKFPNLQIVTFTVPLTTWPAGIKARIKKILGRYPWIKEDNIKRNIFNDMLRNKYGKSVYDLAECETTMPDGKKAAFIKDDKTFYLLHRVYTDDGGHLNMIGRQVIATDLLLFLANLCAR